MRFVNHSNSTLSLYGGFNSSIILAPGEVSKSFRGNIKLIHQFVRMGSSTELAIIREDGIDDKVLSDCQAVTRGYVYNSLDDALTNLTVFNDRPSEESQVTGESLKRVDELNTKVKDLEEIISNKDIIIENLNKNIDTLNSDKTELSSKIERLNKEYQGYKSQVNVQITDLNKKLEAANTQTSALQSTINNLLSEKVGLENQLKELGESAEKGGTDLADRMKEIEEKDQAIKGLMDQMKELQDAKTLAEAEKIKAEEANGTIKAELAEAKANLETVIEKSNNTKEVWNQVCQKFGITYEAGEWKCSYRGE